MKKIKTFFNETTIKAILLPTDLKLFFWFSATIFTLCSLISIFAWEKLYEEIIPYTGWSPGFIYGIMAYVAVKNTSTERDENTLSNFEKIRYQILILLGFAFIQGLWNWLDSTPEYYTHSNPYLRYEPSRPIYTIFLPLFWIVVISSQLVMKFFRKKIKAAI